MMKDDDEMIKLLEYLAHQYGYLFNLYIVTNGLNKSEQLLVADAANYVRENLFDEFNDFQRVLTRDAEECKAKKCNGGL